MEHTLKVLAVVLVGIPLGLIVIVGVWTMLFVLVGDMVSSVRHWWDYTGSRWFTGRR